MQEVPALSACDNLKFRFCWFELANLKQELLSVLFEADSGIAKTIWNEH